MRKSLLVASLAVISMNVLGMNDRDIDRGNYSGSALREITNQGNTGASTSSRLCRHEIFPQTAKHLI